MFEEVYAGLMLQLAQREGREKKLPEMVEWAGNGQRARNQRAAAMVAALREKPMTYDELRHALGLTKFTAIQALEIAREKHGVTYRRDGRRHIYEAPNA